LDQEHGEGTKKFNLRFFSRLVDGDEKSLRFFFLTSAEEEGIFSRAHKQSKVQPT